MQSFEFNGEIYRDDRMYILHLCRGKATALDGEMIETIIFHEDARAEHGWCLVTYRNTSGFPATRVDHFDSLEEAQEYLRAIEPTVPLLSLGGKSPAVPLSYDEFCAWKIRNELTDFDHRKTYPDGGSNPRDILITRRRGRS